MECKSTSTNRHRFVIRAIDISLQTSAAAELQSIIIALSITTIYDKEEANKTYNTRYI